MIETLLSTINGITVINVQINTNLFLYAVSIIIYSNENS